MDIQPRLENLKIEKREAKVGKGYSRFVRSMRWLLPLCGIGLIGVVVLWPKMEKKLVVIPKAELVQQPQNEIGENELLNPHYETIDSNQKPVSVTAIRALQNQQNPNLIKLDQPNADLEMKDGAKVNIKAQNGTYEQDTQKLFLQNNVTIKHSSGYELSAEELRVDMVTQQAFSDKNVTIDGPAATIEATGLEGSVDNGILTFKGPAKLILKPTKNTPPTNGTTTP